MKKTFVSIVFAAAALVACNKEEAPVSVPSQPAEKVNLVIGVEGSAATKVTGIIGDDTDETKVNSLQVFVFNGDLLDGYGFAENSKTASVECTAGTREIYCVVNAVDLSSIVTSKTVLLAQVSRLGAGVNDFEMIGSKTEAVTRDGSINVPVDRFVSRVVVKKVTNALSAGLAAQTFIVKSMHLNNVAGDIDYAKTAGYSIANWYHKTSFQQANTIESIIADKPEAEIPAGSSYDTDHFFYAYPNATEHAATLDWSPRRTTLVLKIQVGSTLYDYPIVLPALSGNHSYEIDEVKITRPGNVDDGTEGGADEQEPVDGASCSFTITVNPWTVIPVTDGIVI